VALLLALALGAAGCGDNGGEPTAYVPPGVENGALLFLDVQPRSAVDSSNVLVYGDIYAGPPANGFRLYVDPNDTGFRPATEFVAAPTHTFSTGMNLYRVLDVGYDPHVTNLYMGRSARNGVESQVSRLTERAAIDASFDPVNLARRINVSLVAPADSAMTDSVPTLSWAPVAGATRYRVRIIGRNGVNYLVVVDGTTHKVESDPAIRLEDMPMRPGLLYRWSVDAIDFQNRIIGTTTTSRAILVH
jgi:hypothetical protein